LQQPKFPDVLPRYGWFLRLNKLQALSACQPFEARAGTPSEYYGGSMSQLIKKALSTLYICGVGATAAYAVVLVPKDYGLWQDIKAFRKAEPEDIVDSDILSTRWYTAKNQRPLVSDHGLRHFTLLVIVTNDCKPCLDAIKEWQHLLETTTIGRSLRILVAQPDAATRTIRSVSSTSTQTLEIRDPVGFSISTGIRQVPLSLLFDGERRIRAAINGVPSELALRTVCNIVVDLANLSRFTEHSNSVDALIDDSAEAGGVTPQ
jgi:hypothetical protein